MKNPKYQKEIIKDIIFFLEVHLSVGNIFDKELMKRNNLSLDNFKDEVSDGRMYQGNKYSLKEFEEVINQLFK